MPGSPEPGGRRPFAAHPPDWRMVDSAGVGPFVSRAVYEGPHHERLEWTSRRHRTGRGLRTLAPGGPPGAASAPARRRPAVRLLGWWIGVLFMLGSTAFAVASLPVVAARADPRNVGITFVVGAAFFTSAATLQHLQTLRAERSVAPGGAGATRRPRLGWMAEPQRIDWWATAIQLTGTIFFNVTTIAALNDTLGTRQQIARVWAPDAIGSVCFLIASYLAVLEVCHRMWCRAGGDIGRRIALLNMAGSIFFGISALTSFILPSTGDVIDADATNTFTFLGAICFLAGAWALSVEARAPPAAGAA